MGDEEKVRRWLDEVPEDADSAPISAEILRRHRTEAEGGRSQSARPNRHGHTPKPISRTDRFGCRALPLGLALTFLAMPLLFRLGEAILGDRPRTPISRGERVEFSVPGEETESALGHHAEAKQTLSDARLDWFKAGSARNAMRARPGTA